jgi:DNA-binding transcriptional ArsR family regulator
LAPNILLFVYFWRLVMLEDPYRSTRVLKALGNPLRYRILCRLAEGPATPSELSLELRRPLFVISRNLAVLRHLDLVWYHAHPPHLLYEAKYEAVRPLLQAAENCVRIARRCDPPAATPD